VAADSEPIAGLASASSTRRAAASPWLMIIAVAGSRCSSDGSTTNSLDRWSDLASDSLSPVAREVERPQAVLVLIPAVSEADAEVLRDVPACAERDAPPASGRTPGAAEWLRPVPVDRESLSDAEAAAEAESPTVLVYDPPRLSVTEVPTVSVS
jgi:hypothetical protein